MTAVEARNQSLWNSLPFNIKNRIICAVNDAVFYCYPYKVELYKSITPDVFMDDINDNILKLKELGYGVEYIDGVTRTDGTDCKLIINW